MHTAAYLCVCNMLHTAAYLCVCNMLHTAAYLCVCNMLHTAAYLCVCTYRNSSDSSRRCTSMRQVASSASACGQISCYGVCNAFACVICRYRPSLCAAIISTSLSRHRSRLPSRATKRAKTWRLRPSHGARMERGWSAHALVHARCSASVLPRPSTRIPGLTPLAPPLITRLSNTTPKHTPPAVRARHHTLACSCQPAVMYMRFIIASSHHARPVRS
jgi:hypothetical protein